jgi:histidinol-phosphatase
VGDDHEDLELALELADLSDTLTLERFLAADLSVQTKPDLTPVTEADRSVEHAVRERLAAVRPGDSVLGEEYGTLTVEDTARRWIIDPIDGTKNYVRGIPVWATLLALEDHRRITLGVVSAPALGRRWWATRDGGAFARDGLSERERRLSVSSVHRLGDAQLCLSGLNGWDQAGSLDAVLELSRRCWRTRGFGDFWGYMLVAEGAADVYCEPAVSLWDLAAPMVIVEQAGGRFTDLRGEPTADGGSALASNQLLHDEALAIVGRP